MNLQKTFGKILVPMLTPFREDQSLDLEKARQLARYLISSGNADSIILSGTTGEFFSMTFNERLSLFQAVKEDCYNEIPLIAGTGCISTIETINLTQSAEAMGFQAAMVIAPYFTKPTQKEILNHFTKVADSVGIPIILYNIPIFTGVNIDPGTLGKLAKIENIVAIKDEAELNPKQITTYLNSTPEDFIIYNGDDTMILETYAQGGSSRIGGVVSGASHLFGNRIREMINLFLKGKVDTAAEMQRNLFPVLRVMGQNSRINPAALWKEALLLNDIDAGRPRLPLSGGNEEEIENVNRTLKILSSNASVGA
ncbi:4-hydroxy-tetrahydrodipicolinate synthase [Membranihabitans maritimus]|uniref:4-hydroxy-tetrahydrodipicolinate synthase n=1 Tax=Membranihabitans maritimus TaxID=2904244 RepID=UPI001EFFDC6E|nr:4-hydroxy-tetrahydrodipicolinate synthase [Membranihabitans maritimus]